MAIIAKSKLKEMDEKQLDEKLRELKLELSKEIGFSEIGTVKNPGHVNELRRTVAKIMTRKKMLKAGPAKDLKKGKSNVKQVV